MKKVKEYKCAVTDEVLDKKIALRFLVSPEGKLVCDISGKLPGEAVYIKASRDVLKIAVDKAIFASEFEKSVIIPAKLANVIENFLYEYALNSLAMCRKAGLLIAGFDKVEGLLRDDKLVATVHAVDASVDVVKKLSTSTGVKKLQCFMREDLSRICGKENAVHIAVLKGKASEAFLLNAVRLICFSE